jgi:integrase/recombinase XerD
VVLSPEEVVQFFEHVPSVKYRAVLMLCYGAGLRLGEAIAVKVSDIDSKRMVIRIAEGKGRKDRYVMLSPRLRQVLRSYYRAVRPGGTEDWMFPSWCPDRHLSASSISQACRDASKQCGLTKRITAHTLRHYAASRTMPRTPQAVWANGPQNGRLAKHTHVPARGIVWRH